MRHFWALLLLQGAHVARAEEEEAPTVVVVGQALADEDARDETGFAEHLRVEEMAHPVSDTGELLRSASGTTVRENGGQSQSFSLRGSGENQVAVFIDEIPITGSRGGTFDLSSLPLSFFEQAEVLRGAAGASYGSGAQGGVLHLRTRQAREGWLSRGRLRLGAGQFAAADGEFQYSGDAHHILVGLQGSAAEGDFEFRDENGASRRRQNNHHAQAGGLARWRWAGKGGRALSLFGMVQGGTRGEPGLEQFENLNASSDRVNEMLAVSVVDPGLLQGRLLGSAVLAGRNTRYRFSDPEPLLVGSTQNFFLQDKDLSASTRWAWSGFAHHRLTLAGHGRFEQAQTERDDAADREETRWSGAAVLSECWMTPFGRLEGALRADKSTGRALVWVPKVGVAVPFGHGWTLRAGAGRAFRDPSFDELYFEGPGMRGNANLRPEDGYSLDFGFQWMPNRFFELEGVAFKEKYDRVILFSRDNPYLLKARDDFEANIQGLESKIRFYFNWLEVGEKLSYTDARFGHAPHYRLPYRPRWHSFTDLTFFIGNARIYATYDYRDEVTTDSLGQRRLPGYGRLDVGMEGAWSSGWKMGLVLKNALGSDGLDAVQSPLPKQAFLWTLSFEQRGRAEFEVDDALDDQ